MPAMKPPMIMALVGDYLKCTQWSGNLTDCPSFSSWENYHLGQAYAKNFKIIKLNEFDWVYPSKHIHIEYVHDGLTLALVRKKK